MSSSELHFMFEDRKEKVFILFLGKKKCSFTLRKIGYEQVPFIIIWEYSF
jgi:hypothetical protein